MDKLAIQGGNPIRSKPFPEWPVWDEAEERQLLEVLRSGSWWSQRPGSKVEQFELAFAPTHEAKYGRCVTSGSAALQVSLRAIGIDYGDEVIVPPYTFVATAAACLLVGAVPVFADIHPETYNLDPARIEEQITARTRAIIPVHIGGCPADMDAILRIAQQHDLRVIEDACQAHAAAWDGHKVSSMGDLGCFSFQASKNINAGEGGIILTNNEELAERCWSLRHYGHTRTGVRYQHEVLGDNNRLSEWQAALLLAQLSRMEDLAERREKNGTYLAQQLTPIEGIEPQKRDARVTQHAYHLFILRYHREAFLGLSRDHFLKALQAEGIPCSRGYVPLYRTNAIPAEVARLQKLISGRQAPYERPDCPVTERACEEEGVWLTQDLLLGTKNDMDDIAEAIAKIARQAGDLVNC
jgi:dTDP-4-amino-4,6-dideoxygalactose transaminase